MQERSRRLNVFQLTDPSRSQSVARSIGTGAVLALLVLLLFGGSTASGKIPVADDLRQVAKKVPKGLPKGTFRIDTRYLRKVEKVQCGVRRSGRKRSEWLSVKVLKKMKGGAWAISYDQLYTTFSRTVTKLRGGSKSPAKWRQINRLTKQKKRANDLRIAGMKKCRTLPPIDVQVDLKGAIGVALAGDPTYQSGPNPGSSRTQDNLYSIKKVGAKSRAARANGSVTVSQTLDVSFLGYSDGMGGGDPFSVQISDAVAGPGGLVFIRFSQPRYFLGMDPPTDKSKAVGCRLAVLVQDRETVTCVETVERGKNDYWSSSHSFSSGQEIMKLEEDGRLYYTIVETECSKNSSSRPQTCRSTTKLKNYDPGTGERRDIIGRVGAEVFIQDFEVLKDKSLLVTGFTRSGVDMASWVRWFRADGDSAASLVNGGSSGPLTRFPDGNIYFGSTLSPENNLLFSVRRVLDNGQVSGDPASALDPKPWIGSEPEGRTPHYSASDICVDPLLTWGVEGSWAPEFCEYAANGITGFFEMSDGRVFSQGGGGVIKLFDPRAGQSNVRGVWTGDAFPRLRLVGVHASSLVLIGEEQQSAPWAGIIGNDKVVLQDPDGVRQEIISEGLGEMGIYSLQRLSPTEMAVSGQRPGSGNFVFGVVDLETKTARVTQELDVWLRTVVPLR